MNKDGQQVGIRVKTDKETFDIPVADVRYSDESRKEVEAINKAANQSKYMKPTFSLWGYSYQSSMKPTEF